MRLVAKSMWEAEVELQFLPLGFQQVPTVAYIEGKLCIVQEQILIKSEIKVAPVRRPDSQEKYRAPRRLNL